MFFYVIKQLNSYFFLKSAIYFDIFAGKSVIKKVTRPKPTDDKPVFIYL